MTLSTFYIISLSIAIGFAVSPEESLNCGIIENAREDFRCLFKQISFAKDLVLLDWNNPDDIDKFKASCDTLKACYSSLECRKNDPKYIELASNTKTICAGMLFLGTDFKECKKKVDDVRGDCNLGDTCETVFGKHQCLKSFIVDECGEEKWHRFRENIINLRKPNGI